MKLMNVAARDPASEALFRYSTYALLASLAVSAGAVAQTDPYQSSQRANVGSGLGQGDLPKGGTFEPRVGATVQYVGNITLAADSDPQIDMAGLELAPGFYASYSTGAAIAAIDYSLIGRAWEDSDFNDVSHRLNANGQWNAVPDWFSIRGQASYQDAVIDPRFGLNYGGLGLFGPGNLNEVASASISPLLQHRFNDFEAVAQYSYGRTWYFDEGKGQPTLGFVSNQDSTDEAINLSFGTAADAGSRLFATAFYEWQRSEFDNALPYKYERLGLDGGYQASRTLAVLGSVGAESDLDASSTQGGLDSSFWNVGLRWEPNERTSAEGRYGERFFGSSWSLSATHRARLLEFSASYSEEPTVETRRLSLGEFNPGELPPGAPDVGIGRINSTPFVAKDASASIRAVGSRTTMELTAYQRERDYLRSIRQDETRTGVRFGATRELASNLSANFGLGYSEFEYTFDDLATAPDASRYRDTGANLSFDRRASERLTLSAESGYFVRSSDRRDDVGLPSEYDGWWVGLRARWTP